MVVSAYVANSNSNNVSAVDTAAFSVSATITVGNSPRGSCVTPDLTKAYISNFTDGTVSVITTATHTVLTTITVGNGPGGIAVTPNGLQVLVANFTDGTVSVISTVTNTVTGTITLPLHTAASTHSWAICISPDSKTAYTVAETSAASTFVEVISIALLTVTTSITSSNSISGDTLNNIQGICISPDGLHIYVTGRTSGTNNVISTVSNTIVGTMADATGQPHSICVLPDNSAGFWSNSAGRVYVFNPATFAITHTLVITIGDRLNGIAPTSDSTLVFVADSVAGTSANLWKIITSTLTFTQLTTAQNLANGVGLSFYPVPPPPTPPYPGGKFIPKLFIPIKGKISEDYTQDELMADWLAIEIWSQRWVPPSPIALFLPHKNSTTASDLDANWVGLENWVNQIIQIEKAPYTPLFVPRKSSTKPGDLDIDFLAIQNWANELP